MAGQKTPALWNRNFFLLWQGQILSAIGDKVYDIALGFWVLTATGSTGLMGTLMAASSMGVLLAPLAGVIVDRSDRRRLMFSMDIIRGITICLIAWAAFAGILKIWMVFAAGVIENLASTFFRPAFNSALPDIVPQDKIVQANSNFSIASSGTGILSTALGGFLYQLIGAPFLFLTNGLSFLASAVAIWFVRIPAVKRIKQNNRFWVDAKEGFVFVRRFRGLQYLFLILIFLNFFVGIGIVLFLPLFQRSSNLGPAMWGIFMAAMTGGQLAGYAISATVAIKPNHHFLVFYLCSIISSIAVIIIPLVMNIPLIMTMAVVFGLFMAILGVVLNSVIQITIPGEMRGKVFGLLDIMSGGTTPLAFAAGGWMGELFPLRGLIAGSFIVMLLLFSSVIFLPSVIRFFNFNPDCQTIEQIF